MSAVDSHLEGVLIGKRKFIPLGTVRILHGAFPGRTGLLLADHGNHVSVYIDHACYDGAVLSLPRDAVQLVAA